MAVADGWHALQTQLREQDERDRAAEAAEKEEFHRAVRRLVEQERVEKIAVWVRMDRGTASGTEANSMDSILDENLASFVPVEAQRATETPKPTAG